TKVAFLNEYGFKWVTYMTFTFTVSAADWGRIAPELILAGMALLLLLADLLLPGLAKSSHSGGSLIVSPKLGLPAKSFGITGSYLLLRALSLLELAGEFAATGVVYLVSEHHNGFIFWVGRGSG